MQEALYSPEDEARAARGFTKICVPLALIIVFTLALMVFSLTVRYRVLAIATLIVGSWAFYYVFMNYAMPWIRYRKFLANMNRGLSRDTEAWFVSLSEATRMVDGVEIFDLIVRVGDQPEDERLFYWDVDKKRPTLQEGQRLRVTSYSNFVKALSVFDA